MPKRIASRVPIPELVRRYRNGESSPQLAKLAGVSTSSVLKLLRSQGVGIMRYRAPRKCRECGATAGPFVLVGRPGQRKPGNICKPCMGAYQRAYMPRWRELNGASYNAKRRAISGVERDKIRAQKRASTARNHARSRSLAREWYAKNPEKRRQYYDQQKESGALRRRQLKSAYGITDIEFGALVKRQHGKCSICQQVLVIGGQHGCHVDHDHSSGNVRGILCRRCNVAIGQLKDSADVCQSAALYLRGR